jgi:hypothetical protein
VVVRPGRKIERFLHMSWTERGLVVEAALLLAVARLVLLTVPFRRVAPWLQRAPEASGCDAATALAVSQAVTVAARNVPWNAVCLPQAMAAKAMLARRGQGSVLHIGAAMPERGGLTAHAWLVAGGQVVVGEAGMDGMAPLVRFG